MHENRRLLVDPHAHLCVTDFDADRGAVLQRARKAGVGVVIGVSENLSDAMMNIQLAGEYPMLKPAASLYPSILDMEQLDAMVAFIREQHSRLVAIGEVGLDHLPR